MRAAEIACPACYGHDPVGCAWCAGSGLLVLDQVGHDEPPEDEPGCEIARAA